MPTLLGLNDFTLRVGVLGELHSGQRPIEANLLADRIVAGIRAEGQVKANPAGFSRGKEQ